MPDKINIDTGFENLETMKCSPYIEIPTVQNVLNDFVYLETSQNANKKQNRRTEGCSKLKRSVDMTSSGKNGLNIITNTSPKWDRTWCPEE